MPRKRELRPGFFLDEDLGSCSPLARLLASGLPLWADREGYLEDRPRRLRAMILPYDAADGEALVGELLDKTDYISRVEVNGYKLIKINKFAVHQTNIHPKEAPSRFLAGSQQGPGMVNAGQTQDDRQSCNSCTSCTSCTSCEEVPKGTSRGRSKNIPYREIMEILNTVCGRSYATDPVAKSHRDLIRARCKDGATVEDFRLVITEKHRQWGEGDKERTWLRPSTLFRASKWDDYLTEARERQSDEKVAENRREGDSRRSKEVEARMAWDAEVDMMGQDARPLAHFMREAGLEAAD